MTTENKTRKNPSYEASAVNLTNDGMVGMALVAYQKKLALLSDLQEQAANLVPIELQEQIDRIQKDITSSLEEIKTLIDKFGSFQQPEYGRYAIKQRKVSLNYDPKVFRIKHPDFAPAVIVEMVDTKKIDGLIKGGLLDKGALITEGTAGETESFSYIIRG